MESKKRKTQAISVKLQIIEEYNNNTTPSELALKYGLAASTISIIVKNQDKIKQAIDSGRDVKKAKRLREPEYKDEEKHLDHWFRDSKSKPQITIDGPTIQAQALKIASLIQEPNFKASKGWLQAFLSRHNISYKKCIGEAVLVDKVAAERYMTITLPELIDGYCPDDIYNADETALFYKASPTHTYEYKDTAADNKYVKNVFLYCFV